MQRHRLALGEQLVELDQPHAAPFDRENVVRPHVGAERDETGRERTADPSEADDADPNLRERSQRAGGLRAPAARDDVPVERDDPAQQRVQQRKRVVGDLLRAIVGHAHDGDAVLLCRGEIVVEPDCRGSHHAQRR